MNKTQNKDRLLIKRYFERQSQSKFGKDYQPAIKAVPSEAPSISRCSRLYWPRFERELHLLSEVERCACLLALYNPCLFELNEQRVLWTQPRPHPLSEHPLIRETTLPPLPGLYHIAKRIGVERTLRTVWLTDDADSPHVKLPYVGDLLLFLTDEQGPFLVNWSVKSTDSGFEQQLGQRPSARRSERSQGRAKIRHQLEELNYSEAGIQTIRITGTKLDKQLCANLSQLYPWVIRKMTLHADSRAKIIAEYQQIIGTPSSPLDILPTLLTRYHCTREEAQNTLYRGIWERILPVDLFNPILFDRPLRFAKLDPLVHYADWFRRGQ
ncbi:hypothetical protein [Deefgea rivuli]|uniref:hypothetical protein n=1 Tax=Deefgea rivuli TaxID=400948 RepID=UPI0004856EDA|nr:hypothetical protein [Deefgea rivuli]